MCSQPGLLLNKKPGSKKKKKSRVEKNVSAVILCLWPVKKGIFHSREHFQYLLKFMSNTFAHEGGQGYINEAEVPLM